MPGVISLLPEKRVNDGICLYIFIWTRHAVSIFFLYSFCSLCRDTACRVRFVWMLMFFACFVDVCRDTACRVPTGCGWLPVVNCDGKADD